VAVFVATDMSRCIVMYFTWDVAIYTA
jgi:hypothetical protein